MKIVNLDAPAHLADKVVELKMAQLHKSVAI